MSECRLSDLTLTYECAEVFSLYEPDGWIDPIAPPVYNAPGDTMFTLYPWESTEDGLHYNMVIKVRSVALWFELWFIYVNSKTRA